MRIHQLAVVASLFVVAAPLGATDMASPTPPPPLDSMMAPRPEPTDRTNSIQPTTTNLEQTQPSPDRTPEVPPDPIALLETALDQWRNEVTAGAQSIYDPIWKEHDLLNARQLTGLRLWVARQAAGDEIATRMRARLDDIEAAMKKYDEAYRGVARAYLDASDLGEIVGFIMDAKAARAAGNDAEANELCLQGQAALQQRRVRMGDAMAAIVPYNQAKDVLIYAFFQFDLLTAVDVLP
jgi:hypothetical protein